MITTTAAVAVTAHAVIGLDWKVAFLLGAIVSPTDAVAPATILRRLGVPRRVVTVIEGENLAVLFMLVALQLGVVLEDIDGRSGSA